MKKHKETSVVVFDKQKQKLKRAKLTFVNIIQKMAKRNDIAIK